MGKKYFRWVYKAYFKIISTKGNTYGNIEMQNVWWQFRR